MYIRSIFFLCIKISFKELTTYFIKLYIKKHTSEINSTVMKFSNLTFNSFEPDFGNFSLVLNTGT